MVNRLLYIYDLPRCRPAEEPRKDASPRIGEDKLEEYFHCFPWRSLQRNLGTGRELRGFWFHRDGWAMPLLWMRRSGPS